MTSSLDACFATRRLARQRVPRIAIVAPVFNESRSVETFHSRVLASMDSARLSWTLTFIDDGSSDNSQEVLKELSAKDNRVRVMVLSRNFGKELAVAAGMASVKGDAVVLLDSDLQHPPEIIPKLVDAWRQGHKVVFAQRTDRNYQGLLWRSYSKIFYEVFSKLAGLRIPEGIGDFLLLDRQAVDVINSLGERARFNKGLYAWIGFQSALVPFSVEQRTAGKSGWSATRLIKLALDGIISFSSVPLRLSSVVGALVSFLALAYALYLVVQTLLFGTDFPGFPTIIVSIMLLSGVQMILLGIVGEYTARIFEEVKNRPLFIVSDWIVSGRSTLASLEPSLPRKVRNGSVRRRFRPVSRRVGRDT